jgi:adenylate kinase family enzyme
MTEPLIAYYRQSGRLIDVDGGKEVDEVFDGICTSIDAATTRSNSTG